MDDKKWEYFSNKISESDFKMTLLQLSDLLKKMGLKSLKTNEKEYIWETFKITTNLEDNPDSLDERIVSL